MRNPNTERLLVLAEEFSERLRQAASYCTVELGGSLRSNTLLAGHQDIDLKVLVPKGQDDESGIRAVSAAIAPIVPFQKARPYGTKSEGTEAFAVVHQLEINDSVAGEVEIEVLVCPASSYIGFARFQAQLPQWMLDAYVAAKWAALQDEDGTTYKQVKADFYTITRALYRAGYFHEENER